MTLVDRSRAVELLHRWYVSYDESRFRALEQLVTDDAVFVSRTSTGDHPHEAFIRSNNQGRVAVLAWTRQHRLGSPTPLRHHVTNAYTLEEREDEIDLEAYLLVTTTVAGRPAPISGGRCEATVRFVDGVPLLARKVVVLDHRDSVVLSS
jgi:hypothetical protein